MLGVVLLGMIPYNMGESPPTHGRTSPNQAWSDNAGRQVDHARPLCIRLHIEVAAGTGTRTLQPPARLHQARATHCVVCCCSTSTAGDGMHAGARSRRASPEVSQDEGLHHLRQQHHDGPQPAAQRLCSSSRHQLQHTHSGGTLQVFHLERHNDPAGARVAWKDGHACVPGSAGPHLQQEGVAIDQLQDPVRAGDEARQAQRKHVVRRELLHHLQRAQGGAGQSQHNAVTAHSQRTGCVGGRHAHGRAAGL